jgi:hypothetical protein
MTRYKLNYKLRWLPKVEVSGTDVRIITGSFPGNGILTCTQDLEMWAVADLVRKLRRAMHEIKQNEINRVTDAVTKAEGPL